MGGCFLFFLVSKNGDTMRGVIHLGVGANSGVMCTEKLAGFGLSSHFAAAIVASPSVLRGPTVCDVWKGDTKTSCPC